MLPRQSPSAIIYCKENEKTKIHDYNLTNSTLRCYEKMHLKRADGDRTTQNDMSTHRKLRTV